MRSYPVNENLIGLAVIEILTHILLLYYKDISCLGGTLFSLMAGQPLVVVMTTAPIALYIKVIYYSLFFGGFLKYPMNL